MIKQPKKAKMKQEITEQTPFPAMKEYKRGDTLHYNNQDVVVVEVIEPDRLHLKNTKAPFNSFISLVSEIEAYQSLSNGLDKAVETFGKTELGGALTQDTEFMDVPPVGMEVIEESKAPLFKDEFIEAVERVDDENTPDLMVREDNRVSL